MASEEGESVCSAGLELIQRDKFQARGVGGVQQNLWGFSFIVGFLPARGAEAPAVSGFESGEFVLRSWRAKVVSLREGKLKKLSSHDRADGVNPEVATTGVAKSVAVKSREGFIAAGFEFTTEDVASHSLSFYRSIPVLASWKNWDAIFFDFFESGCT